MHPYAVELKQDVCMGVVYEFISHLNTLLRCCWVRGIKIYRWESLPHLEISHDLG